PRQLARAPPKLDRPLAHDRHAGGVVAAVFETAQAVDQDRKHLLLADVADDAAHGKYLRAWKREDGDRDRQSPSPVLPPPVSSLLFPGDPAGLVDLLAARDAERSGRHVR